MGLLINSFEVHDEKWGTFCATYFLDFGNKFIHYSTFSIHFKEIRNWIKSAKTTTNDEHNVRYKIYENHLLTIIVTPFSQTLYFFPVQLHKQLQSWLDSGCSHSEKVSVVVLWIVTWANSKKICVTGNLDELGLCQTVFNLNNYTVTCGWLRETDPGGIPEHFN